MLPLASFLFSNSSIQILFSSSLRDWFYFLFFWLRFLSVLLFHCSNCLLQYLSKPNSSFHVLPLLPALKNIRFNLVPRCWVLYLVLVCSTLSSSSVLLCTWCSWSCPALSWYLPACVFKAEDCLFKSSDLIFFFPLFYNSKHRLSRYSPLF